MAGGGGNADGDVGFQIAPMIDLILVLMVFFMSTVALKQQEQELGVTLPGTAAGLPKTDAVEVPMNIVIAPDGSVTMNEEAVGDPTDVGLSKLRDKLKYQVGVFGDKMPVIISPHADIPHKRVVNVLNACTEANVKNISFGG